ncbi:N-terminal Xaa-Pro-Lys N-methyltransferase 1 [Diachasma alloeum]|uniref:N-terminal Xaa-Pro-Lys N-methyltransferase 1 n=1 Tax=Diachasma alloeum TaxID=454923 RepID=UPI000738122E|nr:N-terminal Xaa-Pro-Lys N-methyltransferase 1 [Diachasma alloeum]
MNYGYVAPSCHILFIYPSPRIKMLNEEMITSEICKDVEKESDGNCDSKLFYSDAARYWEKVPATVDGMLGGFGFISHTDIDGSQAFLKSLFKLKNPPDKNYAVDCGSGIGRITKNLLVKHFKRVDLVEQNSKFLETAKESLSGCSQKIGEYYPLGLQDFSPEPQKYDVIWCQWVLGHLQDDDLVDFFQKCINGLKENGVLIVKENVTSSNHVEVDTQDSSMTRPYDNFKSLFKRANLECIKEQKQLHMPRGLYPVFMFALRDLKKSSTHLQTLNK